MQEHSRKSLEEAAGLKPIRKGDSAECPICGNDVSDRYCPHCGQKLDFSISDTDIIKLGGDWMPDRDKVISALHCRAQDLMTDLPACDGCDYQIQMINRAGCDFRQLCKDSLDMLKEQESIVNALKSDLSETLEVVSGRLNVVRCKDCKHRGDRNKCIVAFVAEKQEMPYFFYDNRGDWFCAEGERKGPAE